ncbi:alkaline phosphatase D family protein [Paludifilum halophilum]|uniref:Alkaline phosphatase n=1 Tax=Paludifilum halophilum TaxID=1642702 RepID=A0A235B5V7_9BACL|nr:alkaline phosphatase [Paludifilum halophilum]OYD07688.1 alkaline phosphatase [Paludifilum halophilum]
MGKEKNFVEWDNLSGRWQPALMDRRSFLKETGKIAMLALSLTVAHPISTARVEAAPRFSGYPFTLGITSGDPLPDGVVLWTRLAPDPLNGGGMPSRDVPVRWEIAADEKFRRVVQRGTKFARHDLGHSVHVEVKGLEPGREYYYRFKAGAELSPVGRTKTAPAPGARLPKLTFAFASCQQYEHGYYTAYRHMSEENLDLVIHLGDYIYEYGPHEYVSPTGNVRAHHGPEVTSLQDYRNRYAQYRSDSDLQAAHAAFPWVVTWDDHEVENNYADEIPENNQSREAFVRRRAAAYQAYYEHMPLRPSSLPKGPDMQLYRRLTFGNLAAFNILDTRQYRDDQAYGDGIKSPGPESTDPNRTILGTEQERWLHSSLRRSHTHWNILAQQVFFAQRDFQSGPGQRLSMDAWDGYAAERNQLLNLFARGNVSNPIVLTGDVHANWASDLKTDFSNPDSAIVGAEFVGTSITSGGDGSDVREDTAQTLAENPHIKFFNNHRGYVRCRLTPDSWRTDYRVLPYVSRPGAPIITRASFIVENGKPGIQKVEETPVPGSPEVSSAVETDRIKAQEKAHKTKAN